MSTCNEKKPTDTIKANYCPMMMSVWTETHYCVQGHHMATDFQKIRQQGFCFFPPLFFSLLHQLSQSSKATSDIGISYAS